MAEEIFNHINETIPSDAEYRQPPVTAVTLLGEILAKGSSVVAKVIMLRGPLGPHPRWNLFCRPAKAQKEGYFRVRWIDMHLGQAAYGDCFPPSRFPYTAHPPGELSDKNFGSGPEYRRIGCKKRFFTVHPPESVETAEGDLPNPRVSSIQ